MTNREPWEMLLDAIYEWAGYGEYPHQTDDGYYMDKNLANKLDLSPETIRHTAEVLRENDLAQTRLTGSLEAGNRRYEIILTDSGRQLAHDRVQSRRDRSSDRSITQLTFVLAVVGIAQATALTAQVSSHPSKVISSVVTLIAGIILAIVFVRLYLSDQLTLPG